VRHYQYVAAPFLLALLLTLVGGQVNSVDARGRVIDDSTGEPVASVAISYGKTRGAVSGADGSYLIANLPRDARLTTRMPGYQPATVAAAAPEIRLKPGTLTVQVNEEGTDEKRVPNTEARQGDRVLAKGETGNMVITVIDITGQKALICAQGYASKEIELKGVTLVMTLAKQEGAGCPALPSPSPAPSPSSSPSPTAAPTPSPSASP
jgi:hypothetical protein